MTTPTATPKPVIPPGTLRWSTLATGWLALVVIPLIVLTVALLALIDNDERIRERQACRRLVDEMRICHFSLGPSGGDLGRGPPPPPAGSPDRLDWALLPEVTIHPGFTRRLCASGPIALPEMRHDDEGISYRDFLPPEYYHQLLASQPTWCAMQNAASAPVVTLQTFVPWSRVRHPWRPWIPGFLLGAAMVLGGSGFALLRARRTTVVPPGGLTAKIALAIAAGIAIPLCGFSVAGVAWLDHRDHLHRQSSIDLLTQHLRLVERNIDGYTTHWSIQWLDFARRIEQTLTGPASTTARVLQEIANTGNAGEIRLFRPGRSSLSARPREYQYQMFGFEREEHALMARVYNHLFSLLFQNIGLSERNADEPAKPGIDPLHIMLESAISTEDVGRWFITQGAVITGLDSWIWAQALVLWLPVDRPMGATPQALLMVEAGGRALWNRWLQRFFAELQAPSQTRWRTPITEGKTRLAVLGQHSRKDAVLDHESRFDSDRFGDREMVFLGRLCMNDRTARVFDLLDDPSKPRIIVTHPTTGKPYVGVMRWQPESDPGRRLLAFAALLTGYSLLVLLAITLVTIASFTRPIVSFVEATAHVEAENYQIRVAIASGDELEEIAQSFTGMVEGLRERERMARYVSDDVVTAVQNDEPDRAAVAGRRTTVTVLFSHIRGFSTLTATHDPQEILRLLNIYFTQMGVQIRRQRGVIDKFIGDAIMAVFHEQPDLAPASERAARAALAMKTSLAGLNRFREARNSFTITTGIGINAGPVIHGRVGSHQGRLDFTVIGDTVNLAARLESQSGRATTTGILIAATVRNALPGGASVNAVGAIPIKGKAEPVAVFELLDL